MYHDIPLKQCKACGELKERSEFHKRAQSADGLQYRCKKCHIGAVVRSRLKVPFTPPPNQYDDHRELIKSLPRIKDKVADEDS
jgi:hypothetical protein